MSDVKNIPYPVSPILHNTGSAAASAEEPGVEAGNDEGKHEQGEEPEEFGERYAKVKRGPKEPTEQEIIAHNATHVPFRSWCPHCVAAAAKATGHRRMEESEERCIPCLHADYWFMRDDRGCEATPVIVVKDDESKGIGAHVVTMKGNVDWVAEKLVEDVEKFGHFGRIALKTDQENALKDLALEVQRLRAEKGRETIPEE